MTTFKVHFYYNPINLYYEMLLIWLPFCSCIKPIYYHKGELLPHNLFAYHVTTISNIICNLHMKSTAALLSYYSEADRSGFEYTYVNCLTHSNALHSHILITRSDQSGLLFFWIGYSLRILIKHSAFAFVCYAKNNIEKPHFTRLQMPLELSNVQSKLQADPIRIYIIIYTFNIIVW